MRKIKNLAILKYLIQEKVEIIFYIIFSILIYFILENFFQELWQGPNITEQSQDILNKRVMHMDS